ncbi:MAG: pyridoxal 5'-phosphate synthase glutaminase subunit PdxT [Lachnoclostridium sp.]|jgi:5'-phosphate synthase pdxT subunit|nr:pyridoxal 5'-phosphate synthase glutaminase subunit PdxT [Lachnoclostridium sp.]
MPSKIRTIAVLAVQGAFIEHEQKMAELGVCTIQLRNKEDCNKKYDALILPGGESTVQGKLLHELDMYQILKNKITQGLPVMATCAGLILLAEQLTNDGNRYFATLPVSVKRNAYGSQLGSFYTEEEFDGLGICPMKFIRAPYIETADERVEILAKVKNNIVAVRYGNQLAMSFHPELCPEVSIHKYFTQMVSEHSSKA